MSVTLFPDNYMDNSSSGLTSHDSWSGLQIPNSSGMVSLSHTTNSATNSRYAIWGCCTSVLTVSLEFKTQLSTSQVRILKRGFV